jgi:hypothetical protein
MTYTKSNKPHANGPIGIKKPNDNTVHNVDEPKKKNFAPAGKSAPSATHTTKAHDFEPSKNNKSYDTRPEPTKKYKQNEEFEMNENLENILVHAWNKDAVNLRDALDSEMQSRISDHVDSMVADVSARLFNPALSNENEG